MSSPAAARVVSVASKLHLLAACVRTEPGPSFSALHAYNESKLAQVQAPPLQQLRLLRLGPRRSPGSPVCNLSKAAAAQVQFTAELRRRSKAGGVAFFSVDPGESLTDIVRHRWLAAPYQAIMSWILVTPPQGACPPCARSPTCSTKTCRVQLAGHARATSACSSPCA